MNKKQPDFMKKKYRSLLLTGTFSMAIECVVLLSDTVVVGHLVGEDGISGIGLVTPIFSVVAFIGLLIGMGSLYRYTAEVGAFRQDRADQFFGQGMILAVLSGVIMFLLVFFGEHAYLASMSATGEVLANAQAYYKFLRITVLFYPMYCFLVEMVYADGDEPICNASYVAQIGGNIVLSIFLCMKIGTAGASLGTLIGTVLSLGIVSLHFFRKKNTLHFVFHIKLKDMMTVFAYSIVDAGLYLCWGLLSIVMNKVFINRFGQDYLPVLTVLTSIIELTIIFDGIAEAAMPLFNQYNGEKNDIGVKGLMKLTTRTALIEGIIFAAALEALAWLLPIMFNITDPALVTAATVGTRIFIPSVICTSLLFLYTSYFVMKDHLVIGFAIVVLKDLVLPIPLSMIFSAMFGINGIWIGFLIAAPLALVIFALVSIVKFGKDHFPLLLDYKYPNLIYNLYVNQDEIIALRDKVEEDLKPYGISASSMHKVMMLIEDGMQLIQAKNKGKEILAELSIVVDEELHVVIKDDGEVFDLTEENSEITSLRSYVVANVARATTGNQYLLSASLNRNVFNLPIK